MVRGNPKPRNLQFDHMEMVKCNWNMFQIDFAIFYFSSMHFNQNIFSAHYLQVFSLVFARAPFLRQFLHTLVTPLLSFRLLLYRPHKRNINGQNDKTSYIRCDKRCDKTMNQIKIRDH